MVLTPKRKLAVYGEVAKPAPLLQVTGVLCRYSIT